ncbi:MAG: hypothetical protein K9J85_03895 [Desulfobacteraceae bacterium]|nr:hypothetical protein [Desulfobacteraceae bacterium]
MNPENGQERKNCPDLGLPSGKNYGQVSGMQGATELSCPHGHRLRHRNLPNNTNAEA